MLEKEPFDLIITDIKMKDLDGLEVLRKAKALDPKSIVILISAFATAETAVEAMKEGAYDYIPKPFKINEFKKIVAEALDSKWIPSESMSPQRREGFTSASLWAKAHR